MKILALLAAVGAAYWTKNKLSNTDKPSNIEIFPSRGVTFVKRTIKTYANQNIGLNRVSSVAPTESSIVVANSGNEEQTAFETSTQFVSDTECEKTPQDSVLKRHYLAALAAERSAIEAPYPTDSVLRRHYEQRILAALRSTDDFPGFDELSANAEPNQPSTDPSKPTIPEDSVLKRHFMSQLQYEIEKNFAPRPSDAVLKRHYAQMLQSKLQTRLAENRDR